MNRLGLRLAAGLVVVSIGCLAVFQAQRSSDSVVDEAWADAESPAAATPPTPLQLTADSPAPGSLDDPALLVRANDSAAGEEPAAQGPANSSGFFGSAAADEGVQLASHDAPSTGPSSGFAFPQPLAAESAPVEDSQPMDLAEAAPPADAAEAPPMGTPEMGALPMAELAPADMQMAELEPLDAAAPPVDAASAPAAASFGFPQPLGTDDQSGTAEANAELAGEFDTAPAAMAPADDVQLQGTLVDEAPVGSSLEAGGELQMAPEMTASALPNSEPSDLQPAPLQAASAAEPELAPLDQASPTAEKGAASHAAVNVPAAVSPGAASLGAASPGFASLDSRESASAAADLAPSRSTEMGSAARGGTAYSAGPKPAAELSLQTVDASEVLTEPGERRLEGAQTPSVVIHKRAPEEVRVGKPADFVIQVKNVGTVPALDVRVFDSVPHGMQLVEVVPQASELSGLLCWQLGDLEPGGERTVSMTLVPLNEGELGSVARVTFEAAASVRTIATQPELKLVQRAPEQVLIGQQVEIEVELSNVGSGSAAGVVLQADLAEGLQHPMGRQLDNLIGTMPPGDLRRQILRLQATAPGTVQNTIRLVGEDGIETESTVTIEVISPALQVALSGPSLRYLERQTTYNVQVANSGTANASEVDIVAYLDRGLKFVSTDFEGQYDPNQHAVFWSLAELPAGQSGEVPLTLLPVEAGKHSVRLEAKADLGIAAASEKELAIETLAELSFSIADDQDPIETGTETTYEVRVQNTGSRDDSNVQLKVQLPAGVELVSADPQAGTDGRGLVVFQPIARVPAKGEHVFRVRVQGKVADTHVIKATVASDQSQKPVTKEESTTVYADQ